MTKKAGTESNKRYRKSPPARTPRVGEVRFFDETPTGYNVTLHGKTLTMRLACHPQALAKRIVEVVLEDLMNQRGIEGELNALQWGDPEIWLELVATLEAKVTRVLEEEM